MKKARSRAWKRSRLEGVSQLWIQLFRKTHWMTKIQDTRSHYRKRSKRVHRHRNGSLRKPKEASPRAVILRARSFTTSFQNKMKRKERNKTKKVKKDRRNSVGTTPKPTGTNKTERMLKVQRTSISKRRTGRKTTKAIKEAAKMRKNLERRTSRQIRLKMTKTDTRGETQKEERPTSE